MANLWIWDMDLCALCGWELKPYLRMADKFLR